MLDDAAKVRTAMNDLKFCKEAGYSGIEINSKVHRFLARGEGHPRSRENFTNLDDEMK